MIKRPIVAFLQSRARNKRLTKRALLLQKKKNTGKILAATVSSTCCFQK